MSSTDRLGWAALVMTVLGAGIAILWSSERWVGWTFIGFAGLLGAIWTYKEVALKFGKNAVFPTFELLGCLCAVCWVTWLSFQPTKISPAINDSEFYGMVTGWGAQAPGAGLGGEAYLDINTTKLQPFKEEYQLLLVARIHNTRVDSLSDPIIQKSDAISIVGFGTAGRITIPFSQQFLGSAMSVLGPRVEFEMYLCLIPYGFNTSSIARLNDITTRGGHVFRPAYGAGAEVGPANPR